MKKISTYILIIACAGIFSCKNSNNANSGTLDPSRIVCVSKQLTELVYALGQQSHLVGTDLTSVYPPEAKKLPKVGYHRLLNAEGIISLKPTLVIHDGNVAPQAAMDQLKKVGIPIKEFPEAKTIDDTKKLIHQLGDLFNAGKQADSLCAKMDKDFAAAAEKRKQYTDTPRVIVVHFGEQSNRYLVVGKGGTSGKIIELAGGKNAIDIDKGMGPLSAEIIAKAQPDVILATDVGFDEQGSVENFKKLPGIALTPAGINNCIYRLTEHDIMYFTPETGETVMKVMDLIHKK